MLRISALLAALALPFAAQAQTSSYCNGAVVAERFETIVVPGAAGRATYSVLLRNTQTRQLSIVVNVTAPMLGRPTGLQSIRPNGTVVVQLGYQNTYPGNQPLRGERLEQVTRISCQ